MAPHRDRQFRELGCYLSGIANVGKRSALRIFEHEEHEAGNRADAHVFGRSDANHVDAEMSVCLRNAHMGILLPTCETTSGESIDCRANAHSVLEYEWAGRLGALDKSERLPTIHTLDPCLVFRTKTDKNTEPRMPDPRKWGYR